MTNTISNRSEEETAVERAKILRAISERWHGNLAAYLETISHVRNAEMHSGPEAEPRVRIGTVLRRAR